MPDDGLPSGRPGTTLGTPKPTTPRQDRLHATIITGEIISKTAAADYTAKLLPEHLRLLARAKVHRLSDYGECFTVAGCYAACDLIDAAVNDAASIRNR
jgi:hypothetical protein